MIKKYRSFSMCFKHATYRSFSIYALKLDDEHGMIKEH